MSDEFEFEAPQFHERLDEVARRWDTDNADDFFDSTSTQIPSDSVCEEFFTPLVPHESTKVENIPTINLFVDEGDETLVAPEAVPDEIDCTSREEELTELDGSASCEVGCPPVHDSTTVDVIALNETVRTAIESAADSRLGLISEHQLNNGTVPPPLVLPEPQEAPGNDAMEEKPRVILKARRNTARAQSVPREIENRRGLKRKAPVAPCTTKFRSLAEAIMHFQCDTPPRFRMKVESEKKQHGGSTQKICRTLTMPESPLLATRERARRRFCFSEVDKENHISGNLQPASTPKVKSSSSSENITKPIEMKPFSFYQRDREAREKLEEKLRRLREVKIKKFKAQPLPSFMRRMSRSVSPTPSVSSTITDSEPERRPFKARPANVLKVPPFHLSYSSRKAPTKPGELTLNTEKRAVEWVRFSQELKERDELFRELTEEREENQKRKLAEYRKKLVHRPLPLPEFSKKLF